LLESFFAAADEAPSPSPELPCEPPPELESDELVEPSDPFEPFEEADGSAARLALACDALRSFLAQPEPLKWIVGGLNSLRSVPSAPHAGQALGGPLLIEWTISLVLPQLEQV
jgi:hypothetical protein